MKLLEHLFNICLAILYCLILGQIQLADLKEGFYDYVHISLDNALEMSGLLDHL